ncbi:telomerase reverse transcriptase isoform X2 [Nilaparvata lugens]|nr:telomerase reverse transcriptase isoform X2 [Nilaparvata lugens]
MCSKSLGSFAPEVKKDFNVYWAKLATEYYSRDGHQPHYIVKVDISDAYGSIILTKLKKITEEFVKPFLEGIRSLTYRKFKCFTKQSSGLRCYYVWRFEDLPPCIPNHAVLIPTTDCQVFQVSRLLTITYLQILLRDLKIGGSTYLLKRGIPHAGKLSSSFCQIYYDELDKQKLSEFSNNGNEIFFRAVDDYLYVTPSLERAKSFLRKMILGFKDFGVYTNSTKTLTNFGDNPSKVIPFYGYILNTETMEVLANYEIYRGVDIFYTMTFKDTLNPGRILREKMKNVNSIKLDRIILDSNFNKKTTILLGIFRSALLMSLRFKSIVNRLFRKTLNCHYLVYCVNTCANHICSRVERFSTLTVGEELRVSAVEARWMVLAAFMVTLPRKSVFCVVNRILKRQLWTCAKALSDKPMQLKVMKDVIRLNAKENPFKGAH